MSKDIYSKGIICLDCRKLISNGATRCKPCNSLFLSPQRQKIAKERGFGLWMKGKHLSEETKEKLSKMFKGKKRPSSFGKKLGEILREGYASGRLKHSPNAGFQKGHPNYFSKHTLESRRKISEAKKKLVVEGKHNFWKGGVSTENQKARKNMQYRLWRTAVYLRDDFVCQMCGQRGGKLHADHIKPFSTYPELRYAIDNGRTLCIECHKQTPTYGVRQNYRRVLQAVDMEFG